MEYDVIVIGAGHSGIEAALAASRLGCNSLLVTFKKETIGLMSCNPAIGGVGKGQLVKEIDALGGEMGKAADSCAIQFRTLNSSKGAAVQSSRAQEDRMLYQKYMENKILSEKNLALKEKEVINLIVEKGKVTGVESSDEILYSKAVVISTGTFLDGLIYIGLEKFRAGRINEPASLKLSESLKAVGLELGRLKTCTPPRVEAEGIDFSKMQEQPPDFNLRPFSFSTEKSSLSQISCYLTYTNEDTHKVIKKALKDRRLFHVISKGVNPRYCPSIEEKVMRFPERERHQLFVEPEGLNPKEYYINGLFTFLPRQVQTDLIHTIPGLENANITKFGYGIEYGFAYPTQLSPSLETKPIKNLFLAGQINGTTGYEEAAAQGLIAGINAALKVKNREPLILDRSTSYIGVLIDDLVTKGTNEPYRMFTSRVEYRLLLREDNADLRLRKFGFEIGLVNEEEYRKSEQKRRDIEEGIDYLKKKKIFYHTKKINLYQFLKRPEVKIIDLSEDLSPIISKISEARFLQDILKGIEIEVKYSGFIQRQFSEVERFKDLEKIRIPPNFDYTEVGSLSREIKEKLNKFRPLNLGQASRISGVTPAAISILMIYLKKISHLR